MNNRSRNIIGVLVILVGISAVIAILITSFGKTDKEKLLFNSKRQSIAEELYKEIKSFKGDTDYPKSPEDVIELYNKGFYLLYGNMTDDEDVIAEVIHQQRKLFSNEIINMNSFEEQLDNFKLSMEKIEKEKIYTIGVENKSAIYDRNDSDMCYVGVVQHGSDFTSFYWNYYLKRDEKGQWKIYSWKAADENFNSFDFKTTESES